MDLSDLFDAVVDKMIFQVPEKYRTPEARKELSMEFPALAIVSILKTEIQEPFAEAEKNYKIAVQKLSSVDPVIAYRLSGQTAVIHYADAIIGHIKTLTTKDSGTFDVE